MSIVSRKLWRWTIHSVSNTGTTKITQETVTLEKYVPVKANNERLKAEAATVESEAAGLKEQLQVQKGGRPLGKYRVFTTRIGRTDVRGRPKQ
mmetsp:Transcript_44070/g.44723  ORF Transcript_44070/g.44723 Transcript_44070/m.44723 type:complete len:93 (-) Transcript_44070:491-769(-)